MTSLSNWANSLIDGLRIAFRQHLRHRAFSLPVVATLALTVGATTAVFALVDAVLLKGLPFAAPEQLVWIASVRTDNPSAPFTLPELMDYRARARSLSGLAAYANWSASLAGDDAAERLQGARMSANSFAVLGVTPAAGRLLLDADDHPEASPVVVVSHRLWQRRFGGAHDVIGEAVRINGEPYTVVGVLPRHFPLPLRGIDVVTALAPERDPLRHQRNSVNFLRLFGRLAPGMNRERAEAELSSICRSLRQEFPVEYERKKAVRLDALQEAVVGNQRQPLLVLLAAVVVVLATALANIASLVLVRATERRAEMSLRMSVGASRLHLTRLLTLEALTLALAGGAGGWLVAAVATRMVVPLAPPAVPRLEEVGLGGAAAWFIAGLTVVVTALLAVVSLAAMSRTAGAALSPGNRGALGDRWGERMRSAFVVSEIAAATVLLLATATLLQGLRALADSHPGFEPAGVFQARVSLPPAYRSPGDLERFHERLAERLGAAPGVERLGVISIAPLSGLLTTVPFSVDGSEGVAAPEGQRASTNYRLISPDYPQTVGMRLLEGRPLSDTDGSGTPPVALVSAALAERWLPGDAIGRRLLIDDNNTGPRPIEVVGVVSDVRQEALDLPPAFEVYLPLRQVHPDNVGLLRGNQFWMVSTAGDPAALGTTFARHLRAVEPDAATSGSGPLQDLLDASLGPRRFNLVLFGAFASTAVLLVVVGLYGLLSYTVTRRAAEIGLRMALGATRSEVERMVLRRALRLGLTGTVAGVGVAAAVRLMVARVAQEVSFDPVLAVAAAAMLLAVVLAAAWRPARRAARTEPSKALRAP